MLILFGLVTAYAVVHTYTYAKWLKENGLKTSAWTVYGLAAVTAGLFGYVFFRKTLLEMLGYGN